VPATDGNGQLPSTTECSMEAASKLSGMMQKIVSQKNTSLLVHIVELSTAVLKVDIKVSNAS